MCLLPWLQKLCAVPVLRTLTGHLLLQSRDGELTTLQHNCTVGWVFILCLCLPGATQFSLGCFSLCVRLSN